MSEEINMKYFTDELINQPVDFNNDEQDRLWQEAFQNYREHLISLRDKVSKRVWETAYNDELHDARFINFFIHQGSIGKNPESVKIQFIKRRAFEIEYRKVSCIKFSFSTLDTGIEYIGIHDCVYSELISVAEKKLSHELIFSSGARVYVECNKIMIRNI